MCWFRAVLLASIGGDTSAGQGQFCFERTIAGVRGLVGSWHCFGCKLWANASKMAFGTQSNAPPPNCSLKAQLTLLSTNVAADKARSTARNQHTPETPKTPHSTLRCCSSEPKPWHNPKILDFNAPDHMAQIVLRAPGCKSRSQPRQATKMAHDASLKPQSHNC